jgi:hypothetical protein
MRREYLDFLIPLNERHLRLILRIVDSPLQPRQTAHESWARHASTRSSVAVSQHPSP